MLRDDGIAEEDEGEGEARQCILAQVRHDSRRCEAETNLGKSQGSVVSGVNEVTNDGKPEAEPEGVALDFRDADQGRSSQGALELNKTRCFFMDCDGIPARALAPRAEDLAARPKAQDTRTGRVASARSSASMASNIGPVTSLPWSMLFNVKVRTSWVRSITTPSRALAREASIGLEDTATRIQAAARMSTGARNASRANFPMIPLLETRHNSH